MDTNLSIIVPLYVSPPHLSRPSISFSRNQVAASKMLVDHEIDYAFLCLFVGRFFF
jgi:hypothetical protein